MIMILLTQSPQLAQWGRLAQWLCVSQTKNLAQTCPNALVIMFRKLLHQIWAYHPVEAINVNCRTMQQTPRRIHRKKRTKASMDTLPPSFTCGIVWTTLSSSSHLNTCWVGHKLPDKRQYLCDDFSQPLQHGAIKSNALTPSNEKIVGLAHGPRNQPTHSTHADKMMSPSPL